MSLTWVQYLCMALYIHTNAKCAFPESGAYASHPPLPCSELRHSSAVASRPFPFSPHHSVPGATTILHFNHRSIFWKAGSSEYWHYLIFTGSNFANLIMADDSGVPYGVDRCVDIFKSWVDKPQYAWEPAPFTLKSVSVWTRDYRSP